MTDPKNPVTTAPSSAQRSRAPQFPEREHTSGRSTHSTGAKDPSRVQQNVQDRDLGRRSREGDSATGAADRPQEAVRLEPGHQVLQVLLGYLLPLGDVLEMNEAFIGVQSDVQHRPCAVSALGG